MKVSHRVRLRCLESLERENIRLVIISIVSVRAVIEYCEIKRIDLEQILTELCFSVEFMADMTEHVSELVKAILAR